jgi:hypothetical protein
MPRMRGGGKVLLHICRWISRGRRLNCGKEVLVGRGRYVVMGPRGSSTKRIRTSSMLEAVQVEEDILRVVVPVSFIQWRYVRRDCSGTCVVGYSLLISMLKLCSSTEKSRTVVCPLEAIRRAFKQ